MDNILGKPKHVGFKVEGMWADHQNKTKKSNYLIDQKTSPLT